MPAAILESMLGNVAVATVLALVAAAVGRWSGRPALAHLLWLLVLIKLITPPFISISVPVLPAMPAPISGWDRSGLVSGENIALGIWIGGALLWVIVVASRARRFTRLLRFADDPPTGLKSEVAAVAERFGLADLPRIRILPGAVAPFVWTVGRRTLYFPAGLLARLTPEGRTSLIAHELAHLKRRDHLVRWVEFVAAAVYWWCPLAWIAQRQLRRCEEEACDADVTAIMPGQAYAYATAVLDTIDFLAGSQKAPLLASGMGDVASLRRRLELILAGWPARPSGRLRVSLLAVGVLVSLVGPRFTRPVSPPVEDVPIAMLSS